MLPRDLVIIQTPIKDHQALLDAFVLQMIRTNTGNRLIVSNTTLANKLTLLVSLDDRDNDD